MDEMCPRTDEPGQPGTIKGNPASYACFAEEEIIPHLEAFRLNRVLVSIDDANTVEIDLAADLRRQHPDRAFAGEAMAIRPKYEMSRDAGVIEIESGAIRIAETRTGQDDGTTNPRTAKNDSAPPPSRRVHPSSPAASDADQVDHETRFEAFEIDRCLVGDVQREIARAKGALDRKASSLQATQRALVEPNGHPG